jgi:transposase InsO family protein
VHAQLRREGVHVAGKRVERLMRARGVDGVPRPRRRHSTTIRVKGVRPAPDLVGRDFRARRPNQLWFADIREIPTGEGKLYLAAVIDCFSRACVGWAMAGHIRGSLVRMALEHAIARRRPDQGLIHHSDRGSQGSTPRGCLWRPLPPSRHPAVDGQARLRAGQRRLRGLLRFDGARAHRPPHVRHARRGAQSAPEAMLLATARAGIAAILGLRRSGG